MRITRDYLVPRTNHSRAQIVDNDSIVTREFFTMQPVAYKLAAVSSFGWALKSRIWCRTIPWKRKTVPSLITKSWIPFTGQVPRKTKTVPRNSRTEWCTWNTVPFFSRSKYRYRGDREPLKKKHECCRYCVVHFSQLVIPRAKGGASIESLFQLKVHNKGTVRGNNISGLVLPKSNWPSCYSQRHHPA